MINMCIFKQSETSEPSVKAANQDSDDEFSQDQESDDDLPDSDKFLGEFQHWLWRK